EMRGNIGFVETAPLLAKLVDVELEEARAPPCWHPCVGRPWPATVGSSFGPSEPVHRLARGVFAPRHLATGVTQAGHGGAHGGRQPAEPPPRSRRPTRPRVARACRSAAHALCSPAVGQRWAHWRSPNR